METTSPSKVIGIEGYRRFAESRNQRGHVNKDLRITQLAMKLQQTLEITPLLQAFCQQTASIVPCDSVQYTHLSNAINYHTGNRQVHHCSYQLELEGQQLGEIECSRSHPFSIKETELLERLLSFLIYPLRNALMYQHAVAEARRDPLTQISNRAAFDEAFDREISTHSRHLTNFSLMVIDIDHFKLVNDVHGHIVGDLVIKSVAQSIKNTVRRSDEVFRYGGEEFVVLLTNTQIEGARFIAERIRRDIKLLESSKLKKGEVTVSIGLASTQSDCEIKDTLHFADLALYKAKKQGRDRVIASL